MMMSATMVGERPTETVLNDRYRLLEPIGDGGMGRVYAAEHVTLGKRVAIKVLREEQSREQANVERFLQEAQAASMIDHPNVVDITDFGQTPQGSVFFVMEFLEGEELAVMMHREHRVDWPRVQTIAVQVARGLHAAHRAGVIHRDMKPANIFLSRVADGSEQVKLLDFGIAKLRRQGKRPLTGQGSVFGTARYMSPEQAEGREVDLRSDVYALGVILYELLTGVPPFEGDNFMQVAQRHISDLVTPPRELAPEACIPEAVNDLVMKALEKDPARRYADMMEFEAAILGASFESTVATANPLMMDGIDRTIVWAAERGRRAREESVVAGAQVGSEDLTLIRAQPVFGGARRVESPALQEPPMEETRVVRMPSRPPPAFVDGSRMRTPSVPPMRNIASDGATYPPRPAAAPEVRRGDGAFFALSAASDAQANAVVLPAGSSMLDDRPADHRTLPPVNAADFNPVTLEHQRPGGEAVETTEFSLNVPRREVSRNLVVGIVATLTLLGILVGLTTWWVLMSDDEPVEESVHPAVVVDQPRAMPLPDKPRPAPEAKAEPEPEPKPEPKPRPKPKVERPRIEATPAERRPSKPRKRNLTVKSGWSKARGAIKRCGRDHGAMEGTSMRVTFSVSGGSPTDVSVSMPYGVTPLGRCVAQAVKSRARFGPDVPAGPHSRTVTY